MKREDLEKLGLSKEQIDSVLDMHHDEKGKMEEELRTAKDDLKLAQDKVEQTEASLKKFDGVDAEAMKKQIADLQEDLKQKDTDHQKELADRDFESLLKDSITSVKGKNAKAITALLDLETLRTSKNQKEDVAAALKTLTEAEDSKMLFGEPDPKPVGTGNIIGQVGGQGGLGDDASMRAAMGLPSVTGQK